MRKKFDRGGGGSPSLSNTDSVKDGSLHSVNYATLGRTETFTYDPLKHL